MDLILIGLRAVQALFAIIVLGLTAHGKSPIPHPPSLLTSRPQLTTLPQPVASYIYSPSSDNFMVFASVWTLLILIYLALAPRFFSAFAHPAAMLGLDALTMLFWFAGFIALAVFYHQTNDVYVGDVDDDVVYHACGIIGGYCKEVEAAVVFGAFEW